MIEVVGRIQTDRLCWFLEDQVGPHLSPDVSSYARGRQRCWLRIEPPLNGKGGFERPGLPVSDVVWNRLAELVGWRFDFCLATYSGEDAIGITPHRDASYADYEAMGLNVSRTATFRYWSGRPAFGFAVETRSFDPFRDPPTDVIAMEPGTLVRFNCKNLHAASPERDRWGLNFWRRKPAQVTGRATDPAQGSLFGGPE